MLYDALMRLRFEMDANGAAQTTQRVKYTKYDNLSRVVETGYIQDSAFQWGADGATHAGAYDYAYMRCVPGMVIMAPADEAECRNMLYTGYRHTGPASVR